MEGSCFLELNGKDLEDVAEGLAGQSYPLKITHSELVKEVNGARLAAHALLVEFPFGKERKFLGQEIFLRLK